MILPFSFFPFGVYLTYIYFSTTISRDLLDAARIDGASELRVFGTVALPLATPVVALVGFSAREDTVAVSSVFAEDENADAVSRFQLDTITKGLHR